MGGKQVSNFACSARAYPEVGKNTRYAENEHSNCQQSIEASFHE